MQNHVEDFTDSMQQRYARAQVRKLNEGSFKEVYLCDNEVLSVIPIEGEIIINDLKQPKALDILPELVAHVELSKLRQPTAPCRNSAGDFSTGHSVSQLSSSCRWCHVFCTGGTVLAL